MTQESLGVVEYVDHRKRSAATGHASHRHQGDPQRLHNCVCCRIFERLTHSLRGPEQSLDRVRLHTRPVSRQR